MAKTVIKSAQGVSGCLIYNHGLDTYSFRVYDAEHNFIDYDILHCDLSITITDPDATLYHYDDGTTILDHCPETLGRDESQYIKEPKEIQ